MLDMPDQIIDDGECIVCGVTKPPAAADASPCEACSHYHIEYWRARCPVLASDVGPVHSDARVWSFALANDWRAVPKHALGRLVERGAFRHFVDQDCSPGGVASFCNKHAKASGLAPLDVLDAIEAHEA